MYVCLFVTIQVIELLTKSKILEHNVKFLMTYLYGIEQKFEILTTLKRQQTAFVQKTPLCILNF